MIPLLTDHQESPGVTFAEPGVTRGAAETSHDWFGGVPAQVGVELAVRTISHVAADPKAYAALFTASERTQRLTGNIMSESAAREEAYNHRIKAIQAITGQLLENPERGGYQVDARNQIRDEVRAGWPNGPIVGGIPARALQIYEQNLAALQQEHPDMQFGPIDDEAKAIARGAATAPPPAVSDPIAGLATGFLGGMWGSRRDPIFLGSLVAGPASAAGRTALSRIAQSALRSGLYNAGISAVEQPAVQDWRARIGIEHGVVPAMEDIGLAFLMGAIPGAAIHGFAEGMRAPLRRTLDGHPVPGDVDALKGALATASPRDAAGLRAGEDSVAADQATITIPRPKDVPADLHDDMMAAALRRADQPDAPSPEAVRTVKEVGERLEDVLFTDKNTGTGAPYWKEVSERLKQVAPKTAAEAAQVADEALDDMGRAHGMAALRDRMGAADAARAPAPVAPEEAAALPKRPRGDVMDKVPWVDDKGRPDVLTPGGLAKVGERETNLSMLVRSCK